MKTEVHEVTSKGKVVGNAKITIFETIQEAQDTLGPEELLNVINRQVRNQEKTKVRQSATGIPSKDRLREMAALEIKESWDTPEVQEAIKGGAPAFNDLIEQKAEEIKNRIKAQQSGQNEVEDEEEEEEIAS